MKTLNVFDFDGTLFKSPAPNPKLWEKPSFGKILEMRSSTGLGWFQDTLTLSEPYVPSNPGPEWFSEEIKNKVIESMNDDNCVTVLLTGRTTEYLPIVEKMLDFAGLKFDALGFKPVSEDEDRIPTMEFKKKFLAELISIYAPNALNMYEDRPRHTEQFRDHFAANHQNITTNVIQVKPVETYLPEPQEIELIQQLITRSKNSEFRSIEKQVLYTGIVLDGISKALLKQHFPPIEGWTPYYHHMTICLGQLSTQQYNTKLPPPEVLGSKAKLTVTGYGKNDKACAVRVEGYATVNSTPHITLCVSPTGKPKDSNTITEWEEVSKKTGYPTITLSGTIKEVSSYSIKDNSASTQKTKNGVVNDKIPLPQILKQHTQIEVKMIGVALKEINQWMEENKIENSVKNLEAVMQYIFSKYDKK
eukprot:TRINITY_DN3691_c0_g1_i1.p1 TRINITY_DN3691_c0_g1~~TRINITY_DN3691_c0_g1_i1.p1  ORF type:complete len:418 (-),score=101.17 TRINITY_DN3691_c0_g1_i1:9-1262(-)